jgi:hypothetical protein
VPSSDLQVERLLQELRDTRARAEEVFNGRKPVELLRRPAERRWSAAECVEHLNITNRAYLPRLSEAVRSLRQKNLVGHGKFRLDWNARLLQYWLEPPSRLRLPTGAAFRPAGQPDPAAVLNAFEAIGRDLETELANARGLALDAEKIRSPFARNMQYSVYSAFTLIAAHNRRHIWQARAAL